MTTSAIRKIRIIAAATGSAFALFAFAASPAAATNGCSLISHATVAKILELPHVVTREESQPAACIDHAWSGSRPNNSKKEAAAEKNGTFAILEVLPAIDISSVPSLLDSREGKEINQLGGTH